MSKLPFGFPTLETDYNQCIHAKYKMTMLDVVCLLLILFLTETCKASRPIFKGDVVY